VPSQAIERGLFDWMAGLINDTNRSVDKSSIVDELRQALLKFFHNDTGRNLDQRF
jgi:hypothetical protein